MNDYYYVFKQKGSWKLWSDFVKRQESDVNQYGVQVATVDSARYSFLVDMHIKVSQHEYKIQTNRLFRDEIVVSSYFCCCQIVWKKCATRWAVSHWKNVHFTPYITKSY